MTDLAAICRRAGQALSDLGVALREIAATAEAEREEGQLLTYRQARERLAIGETKLKELVRRGDLATTLVGRRPRVTLASILAYLERRRVA